MLLGVGRAACVIAGGFVACRTSWNNTPLIELKSLSKATGRIILAKCENVNPGGSIKDRAALRIIEEAEASGALQPGVHDTIAEGTGGNTGIGLALVAAVKGYKCIFAMPESLAPEKIQTMTTLGAEVILTPGVPFSDKRHYFHRAAALAAQNPNIYFTNQFENLANANAHYFGTGPEIWEQTGGKVDGFVCSAGTGGTVAGCSKFLKEQSNAIQCYLIDCEGSALYPLVREGEKYIQQGKSPSSGKTIYPGDLTTDYIERSAGSSFAEGIGIDRRTANFGTAKLDGAFQGTDREAVEMAYYLKKHEGVFIGPSAALNVVGAVKLAKMLPPGSTVVTIICDGGDRYRSKLFSAEYLEARGLTPVHAGRGVEFVAEANAVPSAL